MRPHLDGCFDKGRVQVAEGGAEGVVRGVEEEEVGLDFEGVFFAAVLAVCAPTILLEWGEGRGETRQDMTRKGK